MAACITTPLLRRKLALVIGNSSYSRPRNRLRHSINDANALSQLLGKIGFTVYRELDLTSEKMGLAIKYFSEKISDGNLVLFYFSGHGYQVDARNYLMPVDDSRIETEEHVRKCATSVQETINQLTIINPSYVTIFILDCCRVYWPRNASIPNAISVGKGLNMMDPPKGTFIQFACAPNQTASDGSVIDRNGLFTKYLLDHIENSGDDVVQMFQDIGADVYDESERKQKPLGINGLMRRGRVNLKEGIAARSDKIFKSYFTSYNSVFETSIKAGTDSLTGMYSKVHIFIPSRIRRVL